MTSRANYDGLTRLRSAGTWSPNPSTFPIVLDKEIRGGLRYCSGANGDTLTNIPGAMLQEGMLVWLDATTGSFAGQNYYQYQLVGTESRNTATGAMPNNNANWTQVTLGGGAGGNGGAQSVANVAALNTLAGTLDETDNGLVVNLEDSTDFNDPAETDPDVTNIPAPLPFTPGADISVILAWTQATSGGATSWRYIRYVRDDPDDAYVLETGDTMTGPLIMDDTTIQITEGTDTLTLNWPTGTADRTISFPDADGTVALAGGLVSNTLNDGNIFVGNASNEATGVSMSGDTTITNAGVVTIANDAVTTVKINDDAVTFAKLDATSQAADRVLAMNASNDGMVWVAQGGGSGGNSGLTVTANPTLTGSLLVGQTITVNNPTITGGTPGTGGNFVDGYERTYQWERAATADGTYSNIAGATNQTYTLVLADSTQFIRCAVTSTDNASPAVSIVARNIPAQVFRGTTNTFRRETTPGSSGFAQQWSGNGWANPITGTSPTDPGPNPAETYIGVQARMFNCLVENNGTRTYVDSNNCRKAQVGRWLRMQKSTAFNTAQPYQNQVPANVGGANSLSIQTFQNNWFDNNLAAWSSGTAYAVGDMVRQGTGNTNSYWYCTTAHTSTASGTDGPPRDATSTDPDVATDGSDGQFMVEIPTFSCEKTWTDTEIIFTLYEGTNTVDNAKVHPLFVRADGSVRDFAYLPKFLNSTAINASSSLTSVPVAVGALSPGNPSSGNTYHTMATNRGAGWLNWSFHCGDALTWLHLGEYGTSNAYIWWANPYNQSNGITTQQLALDGFYSNSNFGSCDNSPGTARTNNYRGIQGSIANPQLGAWLGNSSASFYVNTTSVNLGLSGDATDKTEFDISDWTTGSGSVFHAIDIATGTIGDDVTITIPRVAGNFTTPSTGFIPTTYLVSLQRSGNGWVSYGTYSVLGSHYLTANGYQRSCSICYLP